MSALTNAGLLLLAMADDYRSSRAGDFGRLRDAEKAACLLVVSA